MELDVAIVCKLRRMKMKELFNEMINNTKILALLIFALIITMGTFGLGILAGINVGIALHEFLDMGAASAVLSIVIGVLTTAVIFGSVSAICDYTWRHWRHAI